MDTCCPVCESTGHCMGILANFAWFRCPSCGIEYSIPVDCLPEIEGDEDV